MNIYLCYLRLSKMDANVGVHPSFPSYQIHYDGTITRGAKKLKLYTKIIDGYKRITVSLQNKIGKRCNVAVARIVHEVFGPAPESDQHNQVDHIDNDSTNNKANNLQWMTPKDNRKKAGLLAKGKKQRNRKSQPVVILDLATGEKKTYDRLIDASREMNVSNGHLHNCLSGKRRSELYKVEYIHPKINPPLLTDHTIVSEEWMIIDFCKNMTRPYFISDHGRIKRLDRSGKYVLLHEPVVYATRLKCVESGIMGYYSYSFSIEGTSKQKTMTVHRLVASHFSKVDGFEKRHDPAFEVSHKDTDSTNNHWSNLEWVTHSQNVRNELSQNKRMRRL